MAVIDYHYTCPYIDKGIYEFKGDIEQTIDNVVTDCCPLLEGKAKQDFVKSYSEQLYESMEQAFEKVRDTNSELRQAAEKQIDSKQDDIDALEMRIIELEQEVSNLEGQLNNS